MPSPPEPVMGTEGDVFGDRVAAVLIDSVLSLILATVAAVPLVTFPGATEAGFLLVFVAAIVLYFVVTEWLWGQTPGKRLLGVVVVGKDGSPCDFGDSLVRNLLRLVDNTSLGLLVMLVSDRRQRIGDHAAGTVVVRAQ